MDTIFKVEEIIDGHTLRVSPRWKVGDKSGDIIFVRGYDLKKDNEVDSEAVLLAHEIAKMKLSALTYDKRIELKNLPYHTPESIDPQGRLKCNVYVDNKNISTFFGEFN